MAPKWYVPWTTPEQKGRDMNKIVENSEWRAVGSKTLILLAAALSFLLSVSLWFTGSELQGIFVGLWVPSILALGAIVLPRGDRS